MIAWHSKVGTEAETVEKAVDWLASHGLLTLLSYTTRTTCPGMALSPVDWGLPYQSFIKKTPHNMPNGQSEGDNFSVKASSSLVTQVHVKLTKTSQHTQVIIKC